MRDRVSTDAIGIMIDHMNSLADVVVAQANLMTNDSRSPTSTMTRGVGLPRHLVA